MIDTDYLDASTRVVCIWVSHDSQRIRRNADFSLAHDKESGRDVAIKFDRSGELEKEAQVYKDLGDMIGIPRLKRTGHHNGSTYLVLQLLGPSLEDISRFHEHPKFSPRTVLHVGEQLIRRLENFHKRGYVNADLDTARILVGTDKAGHQMHIVGLDRAKRYVLTPRGIDW